MKNIKMADRVILSVILILAAALIAVSVAGPGKGKRASEAGGGPGDGAPEKTLADYAGMDIGSVTGTTYDQSILANIPDAKIQYYSSYGDMLSALLTGRIAGFCADEPVVRYMMVSNSGVARLPERLESYDFAFAFPKNAKGKALCEEYSEFVRKARADGTLDALEDKWFQEDESLCRPPDLSTLTGERGTLKMATDTTNPPFVHIVDRQPAGYEVDTAYLFCKEYGYGLEIKNYNFDAILPSVQSGMCDFGGASITVTPERAESVYFSEPHYLAGAVLAVRASDLPQDSGAAGAQDGRKGFFTRISESFEKNFIRESRWKLLLQGIGVTCLITVLSAFFGTLLAFLICLFRRLDSDLSNRISNLYVKLLQGTPMVVLLMILYYVVFARSVLSAAAISVIAFSLNFSAYASEIMYSGIQSIDKGQREAALALGYTENQAFFRFIFPQAMVHFLPVYRGELVSLLKTTSIVGYIAIQDLTKMSDIIRSRTYEAFFPLLSTAVIYFALAWILSLAVQIFLKSIDPRSVRKAPAKH